MPTKKTNALPNAGEVHTAEQQQSPRCIRLARSNYFALVFCGDTGFERGSKTDRSNPRLGPSGASTSPRIWIRSINPGEKAVKRKSQNLVKNFQECLYLVVEFPAHPGFKLGLNASPSTEVL